MSASRTRPDEWKQCGNKDFRRRAINWLGATEQIVGRERNQRTCCRQLVRNVVDRRRVNSTVRAHRCVRTASGSDPIKAQLVCMIPPLPLRVLTRLPRGLRSDKLARYPTTPRSRVSLNAKPVGRYNQGRSNNSLDASGGGVFRKIIGPAMLA